MKYSSFDESFANIYLLCLVPFKQNDFVRLIRSEITSSSVKFTYIYPFLNQFFAFWLSKWKTLAVSQSPKVNPTKNYITGS